MLFTWNTENLCIVFRWWHIRSTFGLVASLLAVIALVAGYEALREGIRRYEAWANKRAETVPRKSNGPSLPQYSRQVSFAPACVPFVHISTALNSPSLSYHEPYTSRKPRLRTVKPPLENPSPLLSQPPCGGQGKPRSPSPTERTSSSRCCTGYRTSTPS